VKTLKKRIYSRPVSVTLSDEMFKQIYEIAEKEEVSMSEVIREAIQEQLMKKNCSSITSERRTDL
jgi:metal-responsive CopG/Arc/MetJ family transcriptional regulator